MDRNYRERRQGGTPRRRSNYKVIEITASHILLKDIGPWDQHLSITNDAENVVADMTPHLETMDGRRRRLLYLDSEGVATELKVGSDGMFQTFAPVAVGPGAVLASMADLIFGRKQAD